MRIENNDWFTFDDQDWQQLAKDIEIDWSELAKDIEIDWTFEIDW